MNRPLFSVIIPLYNKSEYVYKTIESVLAQTETDFEILVVDDGSIDDGPEIVENIKDNRVHLIRQVNQGVSVARNNGIKHSLGKYISFLDADDLWETNYLAVTRRLFEKFPKAKIAATSFKVRYSKKEIIPYWNNVSKTDDCIIEDFLDTAKSNFWIVNSSCMTVERDTLLSMESMFPIGETVYEDFDLWIRLCIRYPLAHSSEVCSIYNRITNTNARVTHKNKVIYSKSFMDTLDKLSNSSQLSIKQRNDIKEIKDRRMVPYIFSLLLVHQRKKAKYELNIWKPTLIYKKYKRGLKIASYLPYFFIDLVQMIRYKIF